MGILSYLRLYRKPLFSQCIQNVNNISVRSVELAYKTYENEPFYDTPVIILHGLMGSKRNWDTLASQLSVSLKRTIVAADARNHGESPHTTTHTYFDMANDVKELIAKLKLKKALLIGHSMGGRTAMALALMEPQLVKALIVVDISPISEPSVKDSFLDNVLEAMSSVQFKATSATAAKKEASETLKKVIKSGPTMNFFLMNVGKRKDGTYGWIINVETIKKDIMHIKKFPDELRKKKYQGPTLFIAGDESRYVPREDLKPIRELFPKAKMVIVENAGHNVHAEEPETFKQVTKKFIDKVSKPK